LQVRSLLLPVCLCCVGVSCDQGEPPPSMIVPGAFSSDHEVFAFLTLEDPYPQYTLFPHADSVVVGSLNGSSAHRPAVRVTLNSRAASSLVDGRFPAGGSFRDSSVVFKEIRDGGSTPIFAVALKQRGNPLAQNGWLWAEYFPDGTTAYSIQKKGAGCIGCHSLEQGSQHDFIRTFERQAP